MTLFDLKQHSSSDLERLELLITTGIQNAKQFKLTEVIETGHAFIVLIQTAKREAAERESAEWVKKEVNEILNR